MDTELLFNIASFYDSQIQKLAESNYPSAQSLLPKIEQVVESLDLDYIDGIVPTIDVKNTIDNISNVYFQIVLPNEKYEELMEEPTRTELVELVTTKVEPVLSNLFPAFQFKIKIGLVPAQ